MIPPDSLRAALDSVFRQPAYQWRDPDPALSWLRRTWAAVLAWLAGIRDLNPLLYRVLIALLIVVLLAILLHAAVILYRTARRAEEGADQTVTATAPVHGAAWFRSEADRLARAGRFVEAVQAAFVALARRLDELGLLQYHPSKTPAECAREARLADADQPRLRRLVSDLYRAAFGGAAFGADEYRRWLADADGEWHAPAH